MLVAAVAAPKAFAGELIRPATVATDLVCTWTEGPRESDDGKRCVGVVHCRRSQGYSFVPLVRKVSCLVTSGSCSAEHCAAQWLAEESSRPRNE
jgi:hypothetical protein